MITKKSALYLSFLPFLFLGANTSLAAYPGDCVETFYVINGQTTAGIGAYDNISINSTGQIQLNGYGYPPAGVTKYSISVGHYYFDTSWHLQSSQTGIPVVNLPNGKAVSALTIQAITAENPTCGNPCASKQGQDGAPIYTNLPYDSAYYEVAGICDDGCIAKPASGVTSNTYAQDGSGYIIGPWTYTGDACESGVTPELPPQPPQEEQDDAGDKACQSKCAGRAYQYDPATGQCQCFGAPGTIDPPLDPTVPTSDPGSPPVPGAQTPTPDPGGDPQLGAQIANQAKQIGQGDAQLGQLGAINNKLGAVVSNQGKQIGQGDKILDYQRRQLAALEDIRNDMADDENQSENPGLPDSFELDTNIGDAKNWTEHDDPEQVAHNQANTDKEGIPSAPQLPMDIDLQITGTPVLSGVMFGQTIEIRFDRPWMETGYSIMAAMLIGIGYLQVFLMINRTLTNNG